MLAVTIDNTHLIALAAIVPSAISAAVGWAALRAGRHAKVAADSVRPNGQGSVIEIVEDTQRGVRALQTSVTSLHTAQMSHEVHDDQRFRDLAKRVERCESRHDD